MSMTDDLEESIRLLAAAQGNDHNVDQVLNLTPLDKIDVDPEQPRNLVKQLAEEVSVDETRSGKVSARKELDDLRSSILEHGVLQPILVEPVDGGRFKIIFGERRFRAAVEARDMLEKEPGTPHREGVDFSVIPTMTLYPGNRRLEIQLIENMQRMDMQPQEVGKALLVLKEQYKGNESAVARAIGRSIGFVQKNLFAGSDVYAQLSATWPDTELSVLQKIDVLRRGGRSEDAKTWPAGLESWVNARKGEQLKRSEFEAELARLRAVMAENDLAALEDKEQASPATEAPLYAEPAPDSPYAEDNPEDTGFEREFDTDGQNVVTDEVDAGFAPGTGSVAVAGEETRYDAEMERGAMAPSAPVDTGAPLQEQAIVIPLELSPEDADTLVAWLHDQVTKKVASPKLVMRVSVSPAEASDLVKAATGNTVDAFSMTPAVLREALMKIVKP
ncbi:MAG: ParB/RepB/Spo0J family partition protein [Acidithiobacillus ferrooxidans]